MHSEKMAITYALVQTVEMRKQSEEMVIQTKKTSHFPVRYSVSDNSSLVALKVEVAGRQSHNLDMVVKVMGVIVQVAKEVTGVQPEALVHKQMVQSHPAPSKHMAEMVGM